GLTQRLNAVDGHLLIHSPTGGPTTITAQLPWRERDGTPEAAQPDAAVRRPRRRGRGRKRVVG
ncbi:hypothetical protein K378_05978, partial [Streptomyces sp. Amel2xB2]